ncbi:hypothetical protein A5886_001808 [Enterococcus sp. 8G7_MSG3316]|uniref:Phage protein n=1 Tax=Candidatus Enterococcus testudinis TaxID=1834191 RepID=A0A242A736_9ENTE|nr:hypothetical protein [Enterococcus sp. 8G7_MSG3316]OTN76729.1 hypothetical protein A5886_001808 [Enterococcus sp. 8G7_MSG3316]
MSYLTRDEYENITDDKIDCKDFKKLLKRASALLDIHTSRFYQKNDLETDVLMRKEAFKMAVAYQIEYMIETGATTSYGLQTPNSWSVGRMSVSKTDNSNTANDVISGDALKALSGTGLLYRGGKI